MKERIGLIAGNGRFPVLFAQAARSQGHEIVAIAVQEEATPELENYVERIHWISLGQLNKFFQILKNENLKKVVMAGQIKHKQIFNQDLAMDDGLKKFLDRVKDKRTDSLIGGIARMLSRAGVKLLNSTLFLKDYLVSRGALTAREPSAEEWQDIRFGWQMAKRIAGLDIGQTVVVKNKAILAVEAIEGTDAAIKRGAALAKGGTVVVKVGKPRQDMRFDIPFVGPQTLNTLNEARCAVLAMQAGKTFLLDKEKCLELASDGNIALVGI